MRTVIIALVGVAILFGLVMTQTSFNESSSGTANGAAPTAAPIDVETLTAKAEAGDAEAQFKLGAAHAKGEGVSQDYELAAKWYQLAAERNHPGAQTALGELCEAGQALPQNDAAAAQWYRRAAEQNFPAAQYNLAVLYVMGKGVARDPDQAIEWFRRAAERGDGLSQYNIGMRYLEGNGLPADPVEAWKWLTLSSTQGIEAAMTARDTLQRRMSREQFKEARRRVEVFVPKSPAPPEKAQ